VAGSNLSAVYRKPFLPLVPIFGSITFVVLLYVVLGDKHHIYHWLDKEAVEADPILKGKSGFLNPTFFIIWTTLIIGLWSLYWDGECARWARRSG
jgi:hypothetical protein